MVRFTFSRIIINIALGLLLLGGGYTPVYSSSSCLEISLLTKYVPINKAPSDAEKPFAFVFDNNRYEVIGFENGWFAIIYDGRKGWIADKYVQCNAQRDSAPGRASSSAMQIPSWIKITVPTAPLRRFPDIAEKPMAFALADDIYEVLTEHEGWYRIEYKNERCWIQGSAVESARAPAAVVQNSDKALQESASHAQQREAAHKNAPLSSALSEQKPENRSERGTAPQTGQGNKYVYVATDVATIWNNNGDNRQKLGFSFWKERFQLYRELSTGYIIDYNGRTGWLTKEDGSLSYPRNITPRRNVRTTRYSQRPVRRRRSISEPTVGSRNNRAATPADQNAWEHRTEKRVKEASVLVESHEDTQNAVYVEVIADGIYLKKNPSTQEPGLKAVPKGELLSILGGTQGWYYVVYQDVYGFVPRKYAAPWPPADNDDEPMVWLTIAFIAFLVILLVAFIGSSMFLIQRFLKNGPAESKQERFLHSCCILVHRMPKVRVSVTNAELPLDKCFRRVGFFTRSIPDPEKKFAAAFKIPPNVLIIDARYKHFVKWVIHWVRSNQGVDLKSCIIFFNCSAKKQQRIFSFLPRAIFLGHLVSEQEIFNFVTPFIISMKQTVLPREQGGPKYALEGEIHDETLIEIFQYFEMTQKTGRLQLGQKMLLADVHFLNGKVVAAHYNNLTGMQAVLSILDMRSGWFTFDDSFISESTGKVAESTMGILMEWSKKKDESSMNDTRIEAA